MAVHLIADEKRGNEATRWQESAIGHVAGRLAFLMKRYPASPTFAVYAGPLGNLCVKPADRVPEARREMIGVYGRHVSLAQLVEDIAEWERS